MTDRARLPNRRRNVTVDFVHELHAFTASAGYDASGALAEVFIASKKPSRGIDDGARDAGIAASLFLQMGGDLDVLRGALGRDDEGRPVSPLGAALAALMEEKPPAPG